MGVVLHETAHPHDAVERARRLITVAGAELGQPQRQFAVGLGALLEDLDVTGAVHRLHCQGAVLILDFGDEHVLVERVPVTRLFPQLAVEQQRRLDLVVAGLADAAADVVF